MTELVLYLGSKPDIVNNKKSITENLFLSGHQKEFYDLQITQDLSVFSVVFHPQGLMNFFNLPLHELYDQNVPLKYINKKLEQELFPRLQNTFSFQERVNLIEYHFTELLKKNQISSEFQRISKIENLIKEHHGKVTIDSLASQACLSRKQFERKFAEFIETTPKQYLKTIRLQLALYL